MIIGDFYSTLGLPYMWQSDDERAHDRTKALILTVVFVFSAVNLFVSIILTIKTNPGNIPVDSEWDMPTEDGEEDPYANEDKEDKEGGEGEEDLQEEAKDRVPESSSLVQRNSMNNT